VHFEIAIVIFLVLRNNKKIFGVSLVKQGKRRVAAAPLSHEINLISLSF
jgi:hypothetical protein|tara:strand:- start:141 stop:287 length:147 start_codon:yes stop_codon:yes gene_type:complete